MTLAFCWGNGMEEYLRRSGLGVLHAFAACGKGFGEWVVGGFVTISYVEFDRAYIHVP